MSTFNFRNMILAAMVSALLLAPAFSQQPQRHTIIVNADGSFSPMELFIHDGDTVVWQLHDRTDAIIPVDTTGQAGSLCTAYKPYDSMDPNEFTGPMPHAPSGIFTLNPDGRGFAIETIGTPNPSCNPNNSPVIVGNQYLCPTGERFATMDWTWQNPNITGVSIRMRWNEVHLGPGVFDWTVMDREIEKAVRNGKLYSLTFKAGLKGTPDWIFDPAVAGASVVKRLTFQDGGHQLAPGDCGFVMNLGSPADSNYRQLYFDLWRAAAQRIRARNAWYRALAYVKPSGANLISPENRLPKRCEDGCNICNPQVWAEQGGYTPSGLYAFYSEQTTMLMQEFPDKYLNYMLIQAGFPLVNDNGEYQEPLTAPLPQPTEQTERILVQGQMEHGLRFVVQHNGLGLRPQDRPNPLPPCPNEGVHPAVGPFAGVGSSCPNKWVLEAGERGLVTAFQTPNPNNLRTPVELESALRNAWDNSDAIFLEIYEQLLWHAETAGPVLDPNATGRTIGEWTEMFHERRRDFWGNQLPDPFPMTHEHFFKRTISSESENQVFYYVNPSKCGAAEIANLGVIVILPDDITSVGEESVSPHVPKDFTLYQNYPNPFNPETTIEYQLPKTTHVTLRIYNLSGQEVRTLVDEVKLFGVHKIEWHGLNHQGQAIGTGLYIVRMTAGDFVESKKILLLK